MKEPDYSFMAEAAAAAREESRKYWQKGGAADRKHPIHYESFRWWRIPLADRDTEALVEAAIRRMKGKFYDRDK
jgi:hypothetical protein